MKELLDALLAFQEEVVFIKAKRNNDFTKSKFAKLVDVMQAIHEPLKKHGLQVDQNIINEPLMGNDLLETIIYHTSGQTKRSTSKLVNSSEILKWGASVTYQRRYCQLVALGLITDGDDDGALADAKEKPKRESLGDKRLEIAQIFKDSGVTVFNSQLDKIEEILGKRKVETVEDAEKVIKVLQDVAA